ncbi:MAG: caspase family protein [Acidobacteriota bacterium]
MEWTHVLLIAAGFWGLGAAASEAPEGADPLVFYASQSGGPTLDRAAGGGNPFASALIELLARDTLTVADLEDDLVALTRRKSRSFQVPEVISGSGAETGAWQLKPVDPAGRRVALVFVFSNYGRAGTVSLSGAARDLKRVSRALRDAGFEVATLRDPSKEELYDALDAFAERSEDAEAAVLYMTGHGFERGREVYLAPSDTPFNSRLRTLPKRSIRVADLTRYLRAEASNLLFFGGCRSYK